MILSKEDYGKLQGTYSHVLRSIETLLSTRPLVMIGFGLRDPDFSMIKDTLLAAFGRGFGESFAIMPDVDATAAEFWRQIYGIEIVSYHTIVGESSVPDHSGLITLLRTLMSKPVPSVTNLSDSELLGGLEGTVVNWGHSNRPLTHFRSKPRE